MESEPVSSEKKKTVLVVDGDALVRELLVDVLAHDACYNVLAAESGTQGLQRSRDYEGEISLLLTDFHLSGMSGIELATAMTLERPGLKVLMVSGFPLSMRILNEGWHFLPKPFIGSQLRALVSWLLSPDGKSGFSTPNPSE